MVSSIFWLFGRRSARLKHFLHEIEAHASLGFVLIDGEVVEHVEVSHVRRVRVAVLVHHPLKLVRVSVPRADVLGLQVLQLTVDVVAVAHLALPGDKRNFITIFICSFKKYFCVDKK